METHIIEPVETHSSKLNSLNSPKTLAGSPPNSHQKTLDSLDFDDNSSPWSEETLPDNDISDFDYLLQENGSKGDENDENELIGSSTFYYVSSHWTSWSSILDPRPTWNQWSLGSMEDGKASRLIDLPSSTDLETKPSVSTWLTEPKTSLVGAGLANLGNTCFLNAVLQCFTHTVPLLQGLLSCNHKVPCDGYYESFCLFCTLLEQLECSLTSTGRVICPWKLVNNLDYFSSSFQRYQQEDAHEFLQCFLDKLESCCSDFKLKENGDSESDNVVKQVFGGRLVSKLKCCNCGHCSDTYEPSIDLSLEIEEASTLATALESFTKVEKIEDLETRFTCENCREQVSVEKQLMLDQAPPVAAFHLKRFKNDGSFVEKIDKFVSFPLELDLRPFTGGNQTDEAELKYDLYAVVVHTGFSSTSGHYYCFIRASSDEWYRFDDSKVVLVQQEFVLRQEAYILFYAKQGTPCFSNFIQTHKQCMDLTLLNTSPKSVLDMMDVYTASPSVPLHNHSDVSETSDVAGEACTKTLAGTRDSRVDSENKENLTSHVPLVASNSSDVPLCEADKSSSVSVLHNFSDVPSCEADKSTSVSVLNSSSDVPSRKVDKSTSLPVLKENNSNLEGGQVGNIAVTTPPRSPSPEIYREDPPDTTFSIPRGHLRSKNQVSCKRQLNKDLEDLERKQAYTLIKKSMPGSRGQQLMAAIGGSLSEGSLNKKSRGMYVSPRNRDKDSAGRRRGSIPLLAGHFR